MARLGPGGGDPSSRSRRPILKFEPFSDAATDTIPGLRREARAAAGGTPVLIGGEVAEAYDTREALRRDTRLIVPIGLVLILMIMVVLLRGDRDAAVRDRRP